MTEEERISAAKRLHDAIPILQRFYPEGWVDFRTPLPKDWRSGLYVRTDGEVGEQLESLLFRAKFGGVCDAVDAAAEVSAVIGRPVSVMPPHSIQLEGEEYRTKVPFWSIRFEVPDSEVNW